MTKQPSRTVLALALALGASAVIALGLMLLRSPAPRAARSVDAAATRADSEARALTLARIESGRSAAVVPAPLENAAPAASPTSPESKALEVEPRLEIWGYVREVEGGAGIAECRVKLGAADPVVSDAAGRFTVQLDSEGGRSQFQVARVERGDREVLFQGTVRVQPGMEILVQPPVVLRGRITSQSGSPLLSNGVVASLVPDRLRSVEWFLGSTDRVSEDGRFEIRTRAPSELPRALELRVGLGATSVRVIAEWAALCSEEGAAIVVEVCPVRLAVVEAEGSTPVAAEELRLAAWLDQDAEPAARAYLGQVPAAELDVMLPSAATAIEVAVSAPGFAPFVARRDSASCGQTWTLALARLGPDDALAGIVVDAEGRPVAGAFASCNPATRDPEVGVAAHSGVRTDAEGRFNLPFPAGERADVRAHHVDHGMTPEQQVWGGRRDLVLRFLGVQKIEVEVRFPPAAGVAVSGHPFEWVLALQDGTALSGSERTGSFEIEDVAPGDQRLFLVAVGGAWFASEVVSVYPALDARAELDLQPARHVRGRVLNADGTPAAGVEVRRIDAAWPPELLSSWGRRSTDSEGEFELLAGLGAECELALARDGVELLRMRAATGNPLEIRLP